MTESTTSHRGRQALIGLIVFVFVLAVLIVPVSGEALGSRFFASLRIARPRATTAPTVAANTRTLQTVVAGVLAESVTVTVDEPDRPVPTADSAARIAGFKPRLLGGRMDKPVLVVIGAHGVAVHVKSDLLHTLFVQAGIKPSNVDRSVDGSVVTLTSGRATRVQYGNCPAPVAATIQNQINGPPPPTTDNGNCVVLTESPLASTTVPASLDTASIIEIGLELTGMSPNQARDFRQLFDWRALVTMSPPRGVRSYETVSIGSHRGILMITGGRRGPTYGLWWMADGMVFTLTGYGSSADAVPLAKSAG